MTTLSEIFFSSLLSILFSIIVLLLLCACNYQ